MYNKLLALFQYAYAFLVHIKAITHHKLQLNPVLATTLVDMDPTMDIPLEVNKAMKMKAIGNIIVLFIIIVTMFLSTFKKKGYPFLFIKLLLIYKNITIQL